MSLLYYSTCTLLGFSRGICPGCVFDIGGCIYVGPLFYCIGLYVSSVLESCYRHSGSGRITCGY